LLSCSSLQCVLGSPSSFCCSVCSGIFFFLVLCQAFWGVFFFPIGGFTTVKDFSFFPPLFLTGPLRFLFFLDCQSPFYLAIGDGLVDLANLPYGRVVRAFCIFFPPFNVCDCIHFLEQLCQPFPCSLASWFASAYLVSFRFLSISVLPSLLWLCGCPSTRTPPPNPSPRFPLIPLSLARQNVPAHARANDAFSAPSRGDPWIPMSLVTNLWTPVTPVPFWFRLFHQRRPYLSSMSTSCHPTNPSNRFLATFSRPFFLPPPSPLPQ